MQSAQEEGSAVVPTAGLAIAVGGYSTAGTKAVNEDAFAASALTGVRHRKGAIAAVADGVSRSAKAQQASQTAVTEFIGEYLNTPESWTVKLSAARVLNALNRWLCHHEGMVTTFSGLVLRGQTAHLFHCGDSRVYRLRAGELDQLTRDHSQRGYLTNALGLQPDLEVDYATEELQIGDLFVLTTDGVHGFADRQALLRLAAEVPPMCLEQRAADLVQAALANGSDDNASCLLVLVQGVDAETIDEAHRRLTRQVIPPALEPGNRIDSYEIVRVLHNGTRSHLYQVRDAAGRDLMLKAPSPSFAEDAVYLEGFVREEWVGQRCDHAGLMKVWPRPADSPFLYLVAEYIDGQSLRQWIDDHPRPDLLTVRRIVGAIAAGLRSMQRLQMVHRDLKPENVMIARDGTVRIIDYGTVLVRGFEDDANPVQELYPVGSVGYVAPECLRGQPATHLSDLYSLGVITYEMLCGQLPFRTGLARDTAAQLNRPYIDITSRRADLPQWLNATLARATADAVARRYPALSEFLADLETPNPALQRAASAGPLLEKDPALFWKLTSVALAIALLVALL